MTNESDDRRWPRLGVEAAEVVESLDRTEDALARIAIALRGLKYGTVTAVVQDGVVVQVERTEKVRLDRKDRSR